MFEVYFLGSFQILEVIFERVPIFWGLTFSHVFKVLCFEIILSRYLQL